MVRTRIQNIKAVIALALRARDARRATRGSLGLATLVLAAATLVAAAANATVGFSGYIDTYYQYNFNTGDALFHAFNPKHDSISLAMAELDVDASINDWLYGRLDLSFGNSTPIIAYNAYALSTNYRKSEAFARAMQYIQQAYVGVKFNLFKTNVSLDIGKFNTHMGYEVIESKDNINYTRGLLFTYTIPFYHTGLRIDVPLSRYFGFRGYFLNGWDVDLDNNKYKTGGAHVYMNPVPGKWSLAVLWTGGGEGIGVKGNRHVMKFLSTFNITTNHSLGVDYVYGLDKAASAPNTHWTGAAIYYKGIFRRANPGYMLGIRYEYLEDKDGFRTGLAQKLYEGTLTQELRIKDNYTLRRDYKYEWSSEKVAYGDPTSSSGLSDHQSTLTGGVVAAF